MVRDKIKRWLLVFIATLGVVSVITLYNNAFAATDIQEVKNKFLYRGFQYCYDQLFRDSFDSTNIGGLLTSRKDFIDKSGGNIYKEVVASLPNTKMTCTELMDQQNRPEFPSPATTRDKIQVLESMGYSAKTSEQKDNTTKTYSFRFRGYDQATKQSTSEYASIDLVVKNDGKGGDSIEIIGANGNTDGISDSSEVNNGSGNSLRLVQKGKTEIQIWWGMYEDIFTATGTPSEMSSQISGYLGSHYNNMNNCGNYCLSSWTYNTLVVGGNEPSVTEYKKSSASGDGFYTAFKTMFGEDYSLDKLLMSTEEVAALYQDYLLNYYNATVDGCTSDKNGLNDGSKDATYWKKTAIYGDDGNVQYCYVMANNNTDSSVYGAQKSGTSWKGSLGSDAMINFDDIAQWLYNNGPDTIDSSLATSASSASNSSSNTASAEDEQDPCFGNSGAIGWFICPILNGAAQVVESAYDAWIEPFLQVKSEIVDTLTVGNNSTYRAWSIFRDFANIAFVIVFLVVIFSQVTGFGIDNYGVKRLLPKLIVTAILVNFSFLICQLVVDITNIVGASIRELFMSIANTIQIDVNGTDPNGAGEMLHAIINMALLGGAAGLIAYKVSGLLFILPLFMSVVSAVIGLFFGFILLGTRQALVIILIVISPVAFILTILPNTNSVYRKWQTAFLNLLLVYPAASLLIGGCYMASKIILLADGNSFFLQLVAMLLLIVPYFMIIPLVRGSMSAIGNIGAKISNFGNGITRGALGAARNTEMYKDAQARLGAVGARGVGNANGKLPSRVLNRLTRRRSPTAARQYQAWEKRKAERTEAQAYMNDVANPNMLDKDRESLISSALKNGNERDFEANMLSYVNNNQKGAADFLARYATNNLNDIENKEDQQRQAAQIRDFLQGHQQFASLLDRRDKTASDMLIAGGRNGDGDYVSLNNGAGSVYGKDQTHDDRKTQSTFALNRDMVNASLSIDTVNGMLNSTDPSVQSGINSDPGKAKLMKSFSQHMYNQGITENSTNEQKLEAARKFQGSSDDLVAQYNNRMSQTQPAPSPIPPQGDSNNNENNNDNNDNNNNSGSNSNNNNGSDSNNNNNGGNNNDNNDNNDNNGGNDNNNQP